AFVNTLSDVGRLFVVRDQYRAGFGVDAEIGVVVTDTLERVASDANVIDHGMRRDFAGQNDQTGIAQGFRSDPRFRVLGQDCIEDCVRDLVGDLVGMTFGDGFGGKEVFACHTSSLEKSWDGWRLSQPTWTD